MSIRRPRQANRSPRDTRSSGAARAPAAGFRARRAALLVGALACLATARRAEAGLVTLDFEDLSGMTYFSGNPIPAGSRLSDQYLAQFGVTFSSGSDYVAVVNLGLGHATSGINGIGSSTAGGVLSYAPANPIIAEFFDPLDPMRIATTDFVSLRIDHGGGSGLTVRLEALDIAGNLLAFQTSPDVGGATLAVSAAGIHRVRFLGTADLGGAAVDDFSFNAVTPVPLPPAALLGAPLLAALGWLTRRRRTK